MNAWLTQLQHTLNERSKFGLYRSLQQISPSVVDFLSNDYLGFARGQETQGQAWASGSGGSRLLGGNSALAESLENSLAAWSGAEAGLLYTSGYMANLGVLSGLPNRHSVILYDSLAHASIKDGIRLSPAKAHSFRHNDLEHLEQKLRQAEGQPFVVVESVYSMDGDRAPLAELQQLCLRYGAVLIVDEAHATGLYGDAGTGLCTELGLKEENLVRILTFGKALGSHGACVLAARTVTDYLINFSRPFIYTTALPDTVLAGLQERFRLLAEESAPQLALKEIITYFRRRWPEAGSKTAQALLPEGPIQPILIKGGAEHARRIAQNLQDKGLAVRAVLPPTVPAGSERLRICLHSFNTVEEVDALVLSIE